MIGRTYADAFSRIFILWAVLYAMPFAAALAQERLQPDWFRYQPALDSEWNVRVDPSDPKHVTINSQVRQANKSTYRVLVLYTRSSSAYDIAIAKILERFQQREIGAEFTVINFEMDTNLGLNALDRAEQDKFNLIFAMGSESTAWLLEHYRGGAIPVVSVCAKDPVQLGQISDYESGTNTNFAFTSLNVPVEVQMAYVKQLKSDLRNLVVLVDSKNISAVQTQANPIAAYARQRGIQVLIGAVNDPSKAREELAQIVSGAVKKLKKMTPLWKKACSGSPAAPPYFGRFRQLMRVPTVFP
jgi:putative ABC transport system substrate-binding protein